MPKTKYNLEGNKYADRKRKGERCNNCNISANAGNNAIDAHAGKLKKLFVVFSAFIFLDYFLTVYAINAHRNEFNPITVAIFSQPYAEANFFLFKLLVLSLNALLLFLLLRLSKKVKILEKVALAYIVLAVIFSAGVCLYDLGIILGIDIPLVNELAAAFFKTLGLL